MVMPPCLKVAGVDRSMSGTSLMLYSVSVLVTSKIFEVTDSGAGPPFAMLYLEIDEVRVIGVWCLRPQLVGCTERFQLRQ